MTDDKTIPAPVPDAAEENAFFPSEFSLSQYTSPRTDFAGLTTEPGVYTGTGKILVIATEERYLLTQNGTMFSTGNHPVETLLPLHHIMEAGYDVEVATLTGAPAKFEWWAFPQEDEAVIKTWEDIREKWKTPLPLSDVVASELRDDSPYVGVFVPGGHGALIGLPFSTDVRDVLEWAMATDRLVISLCHGPAAFIAARIDREKSVFDGYEMVVFPDSLDVGANLDIGYLPGPLPWLLAETLSDQGIKVINDDMTGACTQDRNVITGDSPLAANQLGILSVQALLARA